MTVEHFDSVMKKMKTKALLKLSGATKQGCEMFSGRREKQREIKASAEW